MTHLRRPQLVSLALALLAACASNQPPIVTTVVATPATVAPGGTISVAATATDADQDALTYKWTAPSGWTVVGGTLNEPVLILTAPATYAQTGVVSVAVSDGRGGTATSQASVATQADQAPTFTALSASPNPAAPGGTVTLSAIATSSSGSPISYTWASSDPSWTISGSAGTATLTAPGKYGASTAVTVIANDGTAKATGTLVVTTTATAVPVLKGVIATPPEVAPGGAIQLTAQAQSADGQPLTYTWAVADSTWSIAGTGPTATLTAPKVYAAGTTVSVAVANAAGASVSGSAAVATTPDKTPVVSSIGWTPSQPSTNEVVTLSAIASVPVEGATFAWSLVALPTGSKATLTGATSAAPTFTPDVAGSYVVGVIVTDATGTPSQLTTTSVAVGSPVPTAVIAGTSPLSGSINTAIALDGSGSTTPTGDALIYNWSVPSAPSNASDGFYSDATLSTSGNSLPKPIFVSDTPGSYLLGLQVTDALTGNSAFTTIAVNLVGPANLVLASGGAQSASVHQFLASPIIFQVVASDGTTPIPGVAVQAYAAGGQVTSNSVTSDSSGKVQILVQAGRIATTTGLVTAWIEGSPKVTQTAAFTATADKAASFALIPSIGNADVGAQVKVLVVDQFGNAATDNATANTATVTLTSSSTSGKAGFGSPPAPTATLTLVGGAGTATLTDPVAENVNITLSPASSLLPLPYTAWQTVVYDNGTGDLAGWRQTANGGQSAWQVETAAGQIDGAAGDVTSYGLGLNPSQSLSSGNSQLWHPAFNGGGIAKLTFNQNLTVQGVFDASNGCQAQPAFTATMVNPFRGEYRDAQRNPVVPLAGYPLADSCGHGLSFTATAAWTAETYDVTDAMAAGYTNVDFAMWNQGDQLNPPQPASWDIGQIWLGYLSNPTFASSSTTITILPGAAKTLQFSQASFGGGSVQYQACLNGPSPTAVTIEAIDQNGNLAFSDGTVQIAWTNPSGSTVELLNATRGGVISAASLDAEVQLSLGQAVLLFGSTAGGTSSLTLSNSSTGLTVSSSQGVAALNFLNWVCHSDGVAANFSDTTPQGTYTSGQALEACQNHYGVGNCVGSSAASYVYPSFAVPRCGFAYWIWYFASSSIVRECGGGTYSYAAGNLDIARFVQGCTCSGVAGTGSYYSYCGGPCGGGWN
ncbi:MAG: beta strand repeat-containing protein [Deltaproteobacteria bacterium]